MRHPRAHLRRAQQSGQDPNEFIPHMLEHNPIPEMVSEVVRGKALAAIVESVTVKDSAGVVDLKNLRPDGTIGEPVAGSDDTDDDNAGDAGEVEPAVAEPVADEAGDKAGDEAGDEDRQA